MRASADGSVSLLVDDVGEVVQPDEHAFEPPPDTLEPALRELVRGTYTLPGALLLVLNTERALALPADTQRPAPSQTSQEIVA